MKSLAGCVGPALLSRIAGTAVEQADEYVTLIVLHHKCLCFSSTAVAQKVDVYAKVFD